MRFKNITTHFIALTEQVNQIGFKDEYGHSIIPSLTVAKESRARKRRNYAIYGLLFSF